jgi:hypothetical protein
VRKGESKRESERERVRKSERDRVARLFLVKTYKNDYNILNDHKLYQTA